jgi:hypothetical protein
MQVSHPSLPTFKVCELCTSSRPGLVIREHAACEVEFRATGAADSHAAVGRHLNGCYETEKLYDPARNSSENRYESLNEIWRFARIAFLFRRQLWDCIFLDYVLRAVSLRGTARRRLLLCDSETKNDTRFEPKSVLLAETRFVHDLAENTPHHSWVIRRRV